MTGGERGDRLLTIAVLLALAALAAVLAVIGSFLSPSQPHVLGVPMPVGVIVAVVGNLAIGYLGARGSGSRAAPVVTAVVWVVVALVFGTKRSEGDLIITGAGPGPAFLLLGVAAAAVAIGISPGRRRRAAMRDEVPGAPPAASPDVIVGR